MQIYIARILLASLFILSSIKSIFNFNEFADTVRSKNIILPMFVSIIVLCIKLLGGITIAFSNNKQKIKFASISLIIFTILATYLFHNAFIYSNQFNNMMKNIAIIGGLLLLYTY